jgi:hypothetical protein
MKKEGDDGMWREGVQSEVEMKKWWLFCYLRSKLRSRESGCRWTYKAKQKICSQRLNDRKKAREREREKRA